MKWKRRKFGVEGDVLGISDVPPAAHATPERDRGSHPDGIEVRRPLTGSDDVAPHPSATVDMGGGGEGQAVERDPRAGR